MGRRERVRASRGRAGARLGLGLPGTEERSGLIVVARGVVVGGGQMLWRWDVGCSQ